MNKLDDKVIIDRPVLETIREILRTIDQCPTTLAMVNKALATDLTGWAAVPVKPTKEQLDKAICPMPDYRPDDDDFDDLEYEMASHDRHEGKMYWECLLEASPPLPGGGE